MKFVSDEHKKFYDDHADIAGLGDDYAALVYTLGISQVCREHFSRLYNRRRIVPGGLHEEWQTGSSRRITRLAFNLFTWQTIEGDDPANYAPKELFNGLDEMHRQGVILAMMYFA